ncbi:MAG: ABC transporter permease [Lachnospiraceae bacterium]|nr:ABC transporter permease [Lachnospiraceae bacterium]
MNYITLYIKRTFTRNFKKQLFLIVGIAAFMASLSMNIMIRDSSENKWEKSLNSLNWEFRHKIHNTSDAMEAYLKESERVERVDVIRKVELTGGISEAKWVVSSAVPETWKMNLLYGRLPEEGEILLTDRAVISGHQPAPGEMVRLEVKVGGEKKQFDVKVSGVVEAYFTEDYVFLYEKDFELLRAGETSGKQDLFVYEADTEKEYMMPLTREMKEKFGDHMVESRGIQTFEYDWNEVGGGILLSLIVGGACLGGIIYMVLLDEKKTVGILRALGAKKTQIAAAVSVRVMVTGGIGIILGSMITLSIREIEKHLLSAYDATGEFAGIVSIVLIPAVGLIILLFAQIPGLFVLLRETPVNQMMDVVKKGENLISYKNSKIFRVKHPIWWFSGLDGKRLRGQSVAFILITVMGLGLPLSAILDLEVSFQWNKQRAAEQTYTVEKENGILTAEEVEKLLKLDGVKSAGFLAEQKGTGIAEYEGEPLNVRVQILDESSFERMKLQEEKKGEVLNVASGTELLGQEGVVIQPTLLADKKKIKMGNGITLLSPEGERFERTVTHVAQFGGEVDADYYVFIGYDSYCEIFGVPALQDISVTLHGITMKEVAEQLQSNMPGVSVKINDILLGYSEEQLRQESIISTATAVGITLLAAVAFLICYNSFFYLSKVEQYRKLYVIGASKKMIKNSILFQAFRASIVMMVLNTGLAYGLHRVMLKQTNVAIQNRVSAFPVVGLIVVALLVVAIAMSSAGFASKQVLKELEQKA